MAHHTGDGHEHRRLTSMSIVSAHAYMHIRAEVGDGLARIEARGRARLLLVTTRDSPSRPPETRRAAEAANLGIVD